MILTLITCPAVSNIWFRISSVTLWSRPPIYKALLFGSGAALLTDPPGVAGDKIPSGKPGNTVVPSAVGMGLLFWGITTGGRESGCIWPFPLLIVPGAGDACGGRDKVPPEVGTGSAMVWFLERQSRIYSWPLPSLNRWRCKDRKEYIVSLSRADWPLSWLENSCWDIAIEEDEAGKPDVQRKYSRS